MNIGIDLRLLEKGDNYSNFIFKIMQIFIKDNNYANYNIYLDLAFGHINLGQNTKNKIIKDRPGSIKEQRNFNKILKKDKNDLAIFFNYKKPFRYKEKYILFIPDLTEFHYPPIKSIFGKFFENFLLNNSTKNAYKIICFNKNTKTELNDKLNIKEDKIKILKPFFNKKAFNTNLSINIELNSKYNINGDFFIYNAGAGNNKNLDRLVEVFSSFNKNNINLHLVILDDETVKDVNLRKKIIECDALKIIHFIGNVQDNEKEMFYKNSKGTIYPLLYDSFPFLLEEAINFENKIIASNLENIKEIFGDTISYFNPGNQYDMYEKILAFSKTKRKNDYKEIFNKYNINDCANNLIKIIKEV